MIVNFIPYPTGFLWFGAYSNDDVDAPLMGSLECHLMTINQPKTGIIKDLMTHERFRRQGVATYLLTTVQECLADPAGRLGLEIPLLDTLLASVEHHSPEVGIFAKCNFHPVGSNASRTVFQFDFRRHHADISMH
ncbi:MAG: GNAT family N-acetyltransferase [Candidatus Moranbacteria bacterium]|nr:GNAT family N-acetyltransferase [Candidatus Moranbacteria bacterium]